MIRKTVRLNKRMIASTETLRVWLIWKEVEVSNIRFEDGLARVGCVGLDCYVVVLQKLLFLRSSSYCAHVMIYNVLTFFIIIQYP